MAEIVVQNLGVGLSTHTLEDENEYWYAQSFQAPSPFVPSAVVLTFATNQGAHTGTIDIDFYAVDGEGDPTGGSLCNGSLEFSLTGTTAPTYHEPSITIDTSYTFEEDTIYAFVAKITVTERESNLLTLLALPSYTLTPGEMMESADGGTTWTTTITRDFTTDVPMDMEFVLWGVPALPEKAITPGPTNANEAVELDQEDLTWVDGGLGEANEATHFSVYYGTTSGALTLVSSGQAAGVATNLFTVWGVEYGSPYDYAVTRYWRIDSTNTAGTTTGDEWSFTTLSEGYVPPYPPPRPDPYDPDVGGGGSYATNLLVIGHKVLYYRET